MPQKIVFCVKDMWIPRNFLGDCGQYQVDKHHDKDCNSELELLDPQPGTERDGPNKKMKRNRVRSKIPLISFLSAIDLGCNSIHMREYKLSKEITL